MQNMWRIIRQQKNGFGITDDRGSVMLEAVFVFPIVLALIFGAAQVAHIWTARQVVQYAAYSAARAAMVAEQSEMQNTGEIAAKQVCSWICLGQAAGETGTEIAGWGEIKGSGAVNRKTRVTVRMADEWNVEATVEFDFALVMPIAGAIMGWGVNPWRSGSEWLEQRADVTGNQHRYQDTVQYPHVRFKETVRMSRPSKVPANTKMW
jgi:Flp pilus assembly protein TadG